MGETASSGVTLGSTVRLAATGLEATARVDRYRTAADENRASLLMDEA
jgi:hypothetical protein